MPSHIELYKYKKVQKSMEYVSIMWSENIQTFSRNRHHSVIVYHSPPSPPPLPPISDVSRLTVEKPRLAVAKPFLSYLGQTEMETTTLFL